MSVAPIFDAAVAAARLQRGIADAVARLHRRGAVVATSGGVDSSVVAALCTRSLGADHVLCLRLPETGLGEKSSNLGASLADALGVASVEQSVTAALEALGCYDLQVQAIRAVVPDFQPDWPFKLVRSAATGSVIVFSVVIATPDGRVERHRLPSSQYRLLLGATNMKQRVRALLTYTWADRLHYAVAGTPNLLEFDQGFFVKGGDGLADLKPIAGLYKWQVYALARWLELPAEIVQRQPTTETFSLPQSQEEFYFGHPLEQMDLLLWGERHGVEASDLALHTQLPARTVETAYAEIRRRRSATAYLHAPPLMVDAAERGGG